MGQEYFINSDELENRVRQLLPSQGGRGAGVDLSASTQIVPIIDLTEQAQGSAVRPDLQTALSFDTSSDFAVANTTTTLINNTGYYRVFGNLATQAVSFICTFRLSDGVTNKSVYQFFVTGGTPLKAFIVPYDFIVFLKAGDSFSAFSNNANAFLVGTTRQIATIDGTLIDP